MNEPSDLAAAGLVADRLAAEDAARMERLNRLIAAGKGNKVLKGEDDMGVERKYDRTCCTSKGPRHLASCPTQSKANVARAEPARVLIPRKSFKERVASLQLFDPKVATVEQLVEAIEACRQELTLRQEQAEEQLQTIRAALKGAA